MKVIAFEEFIKKPQGTVFCKIYGDILGNICIKGKSWAMSCPDGAMDFMYLNIKGELLNDSILYQDVWQRDGLFDKGQRYAVYEKDDIIHLIEKLQKALELF